MLSLHPDALSLTLTFVTVLDDNTLNLSPSFVAGFFPLPLYNL